MGSAIRRRPFLRDIARHFICPRLFHTSGTIVSIFGREDIITAITVLSVLELSDLVTAVNLQFLLRLSVSCNDAVWAACATDHFNCRIIMNLR